MRKVVIRKEYEDIYSLLVAAEVLRWSTFSLEQKSLTTYTQLDYKISGQPGAGEK